ncbi:hypothetical protein [Kitasatospora purpeofusca]|uniref:hypothetical protein n=1 Tax=Kitasatospora purpeofusca TaxID=67352 RepID=UPI0035DCADFC
MNDTPRLPLRWVVIGALSIGAGVVAGVAAALGLTTVVNAPMGSVLAGLSTGMVTVIGSMVRLNKIIE